MRFKGNQEFITRGVEFAKQDFPRIAVFAGKIERRSFVVLDGGNGQERIGCVPCGRVVFSKRAAASADPGQLCLRGRLFSLLLTPGRNKDA